MDVSTDISRPTCGDVWAYYTPALHFVGPPIQLLYVTDCCLDHPIMLKEWHLKYTKAFCLELTSGFPCR